MTSIIYSFLILILAVFTLTNSELTRRVYSPVSKRKLANTATRRDRRSCSVATGRYGFICWSLLRVAFDLHVVNRDRVHWNIRARLSGRIAHSFCDRALALNSCKSLVDFAEHIHHLDLVFDLTASNKSQEMHDAQLLRKSRKATSCC